MVVKSVDEQPSAARQPKAASRRVGERDSERVTVDAASRRVGERPTASLCSGNATRRDAASTVARYKTRTPLSTYFLHLFSFSIALASAFRLSAATSPTAGVPAAAYVQDGLVAHFDGIENAGAGLHDEAPTDWINLATGATDAVLPEGKYTVSSNSIALASKQALAEGLSCASNTSTITIQTRVRATAAPTGQYDLLCVTISSRGGVGFDSRGNNGYAYFQPSSSSWGSHKMIYKWWGNFAFASRAYDEHCVTAFIPVSSWTGSGAGRILQDGVDQAYISNWTSGTVAAPSGKVYIGPSSATSSCVRRASSRSGRAARRTASAATSRATSPSRPARASTSTAAALRSRAGWAIPRFRVTSTAAAPTAARRRISGA